MIVNDIEGGNQSIMFIHRSIHTYVGSVARFGFDLVVNEQRRIWLMEDTELQL